MIEPPAQTARTALDLGLSGYALTVPIWLQGVQTYVGLFMVLGGALLLVLRLLIAWREWRGK